ncbi:MAG: MBL fold metallo-hydrolase [Ginsengibacter sp.]
MSLFITSLNSGSNGNCYYVGNERDAILVDAGISCREIEKRMKQLGLHIHKVKAVFVSHEHSDHIKGLSVLSTKYNFPVYTTTTTLLHGGFSVEKHLVKNFTANEKIVIGDISITPFTKFHDACDPHSFTISCNNVTVGVFTDIGVACKNVISHFKQCHAAFLEANYDDDILEQGNYPYHLKKRIKGGTGHLSNKEALDLFLKYRPSFMSHLFLSHLSKNNNCPQMVTDLFNAHAGAVQVIIASRDAATPVYQIIGAFNKRKNNNPTLTSMQQLEFSFL